jgi:hypothetical protein
MQYYYLYFVDKFHPDRLIPQLFIDYQDNIFQQNKFMSLATCFFDYPIFMMLDSGLFMVSNEVCGNEFHDINEETNIEKMHHKYGIKAENSKIQELRKNFQKTDVLTIMIASPICIIITSSTQMIFWLKNSRIRVVRLVLVSMVFVYACLFMLFLVF